jgi:predicted ester cyclase
LTRRAGTIARVRFSGMTIARFNGKLVEGWNMFDQLSMFQQLGLFTPPV